MSRFVNVAGSPVRLDRLTAPQPKLRAPGVSVTSGATANTPGAWVEVFASTATDVHWAQILVMSGTAFANGSSAMLLDIGVGSSGSEVAVVSSVQSGFRASSQIALDIPCPIPAGSRVAIRLAGESTRTSLAITFNVLLGALDVSIAAPVTIGAVPAASSGTALPNPNVVGTKGAWIELTATVPVALMGVHLAPALTGTAAAATADGLIDIGVGPSGSEVVVVSDWVWSSTASETVQYQPPLVGCHIPAGSRISARYQRSATLRCDLILHGVPA